MSYVCDDRAEIEVLGSLKRENELWLLNARDFALVQILPRKDLGNSAMKK